MDRSGLSRAQVGNGLTVVPSIDAEVAVRGKQDWIGHYFRHPNQAGIRQTHWNVRVFFKKIKDLLDALADLKSANEGASVEKIDQSWRAARAKDVEGLG